MKQTKNQIYRIHGFLSHFYIFAKQCRIKPETNLKIHNHETHITLQKTKPHL